MREIGERAFDLCLALSDVEFGDRLETIGDHAFAFCNSLGSIKIPSVRTVQTGAFSYCKRLTDVEFGVDLETIGFNSFDSCTRLERIVIPLKDNLFPVNNIEQRCTQFDRCYNLTTIKLVGAEEINSIISCFLESWRNEMNQEINRINLELPNIPNTLFRKAAMIRRWVRSVIDRMDHYKAEHNRLLKEHMVNLELAVWKAKLDEKEDDLQTKRVEVDEKRSKEEKRITSGADIIIKNVLPFLKLA